ncbi:RNA-binding protein 42 [Picochlorum sp. SENEW3]|nr:RNA-binding protein 42 [Picochlorum sp. SENEW3]
MGDELADFYAEIATVEKEVSQSHRDGGSDADVAARQSSQRLSSGKASVQASVKRSAVISNAPSVSRVPEEVYNEDVRSISQPNRAKAPPTATPGQANVGVIRQAAGRRWVDPKLLEWPENDFRIFVGNLGPEVTDSMLTSAFNRYESFNMAKVMRQTHTNKSKGFGFVSLGSIKEGAQALREMQGQYIGNRPCQVKKAATEDRTVKDKFGRPVKKRLSTKHGSMKRAKF